MINNYRDIPELSKEDTYSMVFLLMFIFKKDKNYSILNELPYILDFDNFMKFIKYFEGQTITIPTMNEMSKYFKVLLLYQYYVVERGDWKKSLIKSGFDPDRDSYRAQRYLYAFRKDIEQYKLGDLINEENKDKGIK